MLATRTKTKKKPLKVEKTTKIKLEKSQPRRDRAGADFFLVLFLLSFWNFGRFCSCCQHNFSILA